MATAIRPISHEDRLSLVEHLDELRRRLVVMAVALGVAFAFCAWQSGALLKIINKPLDQTASGQNSQSKGGLRDTERNQATLRGALQKLSLAVGPLATTKIGTAADRKRLADAAQALDRAAKALPKSVPKRRPVTLGISEPFTQTLTVAGYFALLIALPIILYQLYAFVLPAFRPEERKLAMPLMMMVPALFISGVVFGYYVVLPPAVSFLQNFNKDQFDILIQAKDYYKFAILALLSLGVLFQIPVGVLALTRLGIVTPKQLRKNRRYAIVVEAVVAMLLPGTDPVTMLISMAPLVVLYEGSIVLASAVGRPGGRAFRDADDAASDDDSDDDPDDPDDPDEPGDDGPGHGGPDGDAPSSVGPEDAVDDFSGPENPFVAAALRGDDDPGTTKTLVVPPDFDND